MTTIAFRDGIIAADSRAEVGGWIAPYSVPKLFYANGLLIGLAGNPYLREGLISYLTNSEPAPDFGDDSAAFVIYEDGILLKYAHTSMLKIIGPFAAIGSGAPLAHAAMHAGATAPEAVRIAALLDPYTGGEVVSMTVG